MNFIQRIKSRSFLINLGVFILAVFVIILGLSIFLSIYTHHGESLTVPDFKGQSVDQVKSICNDKDLTYEIKDSVFVPGQPKLTVVEQNPKPGAKVKRYRRIYIVINTDKAPKIPMPNLGQDCPLRQAEKILENAGLNVGTHPEYVPNIALNAVIQTKYHGQIITPGTLIDKGSTIEFVLGDGGKGGASRTVPDLTGKAMSDVKFILTADNILVGRIDSSGVKSMKTAIIYKQNPLPGSKISQGDIVNIWLKDK